jgi:oligopeptide/dipeptide ABC transporter ATP-binding protein
VATKVLGMLAKLQAEHQTALVFVTHDISLARRLCTRMVVMYGGRNVEEGPTQDVLRSPAHPYTKALVSCLPSAATTPRTRLVEIPGEPLRAEGLATAGCSFAPRCPIADARCRSEDPPIVILGESHTVECWKPGDASGFAAGETGPAT